MNNTDLIGRILVFDTDFMMEDVDGPRPHDTVNEDHFVLYSELPHNCKVSVVGHRGDAWLPPPKGKTSSECSIWIDRHRTILYSVMN